MTAVVAVYRVGLYICRYVPSIDASADVNTPEHVYRHEGINDKTDRKTVYKQTKNITSYTSCNYIMCAMSLITQIVSYYSIQHYTDMWTQM